MVIIDNLSVVVKPEVAKSQVPETPSPGLGVPVAPGEQPVALPGAPAEPGEQLPKRFFGTVGLDPDRAGRDAGKVAEEVIQHLSTFPGAKVQVTMEIEGEIPAGVPDDTKRVVEENCQTLKFKSWGFEKL